VITTRSRLTAKIAKAVPSASTAGVSIFVETVEARHFVSMDDRGTLAKSLVAEAAASVIMVSKSRCARMDVEVAVSVNMAAKEHVAEIVEALAFVSTGNIRKHARTVTSFAVRLSLAYSKAISLQEHTVFRDICIVSIQTTQKL
jgi:hypothetical protein